MFFRRLREIVLPFSLFCGICLVFLPEGQAQDISLLDQRQQYKNIQLGDSIQQHTFFFAFEKVANDGYHVYALLPDSALPYQLPGDSLNPIPKDTLLPNPYLNIGYIQLRKMHLLVYKEIIYEIIITLDAAYFSDIKQVLVSAYGEPNELNCETIETEERKRIDCLWKGTEMALWCRLMEYGDNQQKTLFGMKNYKAVANIKKQMHEQAVQDILGEH